jgi:GNAT superfamily N-acetyltransferase
MSITIRPARPADAVRLPDVERAAGAVFRTLPGLAWIADGEPMPADEHRRLIGYGLCWVAEAAGSVIGFLAAERAGPELHVVELSVRPEYQRQGVGRQLIEAALAAADNAGLTAVTLTTFRDVPWNAPFYARLGFREVPPAAISSRLAARTAQDSARGLPAERRCAMRFALSQL